MAEKSDLTEKPEENLDLSGLSSMSLGPDWVSGKKPRTQMPRESREDRPRPRGAPHKDRRGFKPRRQGGHESRGRPQRGHGGGHGHGHDRRDHEPFKPIVEVDFYPEEEPFRVLSQALRTSYRTFELFEIARLILDKPDRFVCLVRDPSQKEGETALLHASVPDGLPFRSEEEALAHVFRHYMADFFNKETHEVEPPAGSFQLVNKCGMTGEILGAPNYHRYQAMCREHHAAKLAHVPYAKFEQRIESTREEEDIQAWLESMKVQTKYTLKEMPELSFGNAEDARLYLVTQSKDKLVRPAYSARFSGKALALLSPTDPIRKSVDFLLEHQLKFPLDTANHLRGRLRRMHFAVYKRGSKGISFVCAVKRRFRKPDEILADNLQELIDFLDAHPNFPAKDLPKAFLGIDPDRKPAEAPSPAAEEVAKEVAVEETGDEKEAEKAAVEEKPAPKEDAGPAEDLKAVQQLKVDLRYLVSEGYVTEYSDGRLFVPGIREEEIRHEEKLKEQAAIADAVKSVSEPPKEKEAPKSEAEAPAEPKAPAEPEAVAEPVEAKEAPEEKAVEEAPAAPEPVQVEEPQKPAEPEAVVEPEATPAPEVEAVPEVKLEAPAEPSPVVEAVSSEPETEDSKEPDEEKPKAEKPE